MILITGAAGKTGQAIIQQLRARNVPIRAMVRNQKQMESLQQPGMEQTVSGIISGDVTSADDLLKATANIQTIYHICPNMHPEEVAIGEKLVAAARANRVERIVYHSVLHPQTEEMPHHWNKLRVEEVLLKSGIDYTILQPCAYMQNVLAYRKAIVETGVYRIPYAAETRIGMVDLEEIAEVAAEILCNSTHRGAIYELANGEALSQMEVAQVIALQLGREVTAEAADREQWALLMRQSGMNEYAISTLRRMFEYYERYGFWGNGKILEMLLGRRPKSFTEWVSTQQWR